MSESGMRGALKRFDGQHMAPLQSVVDHGPPTEDDRLDLAEFLAADDAVLREAALWLILHWARKGVRFDPEFVGGVLAQFSTLENWRLRLAAVQAVRHLEIPLGSRAELDRWIAERRADENAFVRAWAWDATVALTLADGGPVEPLMELVDDAMDDPRASVRARLRALRKELRRA